MADARAKLRPPPVRRLRVYAFDPNASLDLGSAKYSHATIALPWEPPARPESEIPEPDRPWAEGVSPGPINEYLEVIDVDPCSDQFYEAIDLQAPEVLAQDGLPPSEGDPRFHQQMVFAVVMKTIKLFERALGRKVLWAPTWDDTAKTYRPTPKLRVYPHALREANAYYSPTKRALLFGYFPASQRAAGASWIFTALSHDIIVHETTHAILDGLHPRYSEPTSQDSLAFHEAFADIAALFSHFQLYEAVYDFIARSGGRLDQSGLLSGLASQFAQGTSGRLALRDYINKDPKPDLLQTTDEAHDRGAILVAAVFDAFLSIYSARTTDLLRMGNVRLGSGEYLHPDLVARLAKEAGKAADHVLRMCIRALDYLPPVDVRFGEFLRAIITADTDLVPDDRLNYRLAFVEAFRRRGILPDNCLSMSPDNLLWDEPPSLPTDDILDAGLNLMPEYQRRKIAEVSESNRKKVWYWLLEPAVQVDHASEADRAEIRRLLSQARAVFSEQDPVAADAPDPNAEALLDDVVPRLRKLGVDESRLGMMREAMAAAGNHFDKWQSLLKLLDASDAPVAATSRLKGDAVQDTDWEQALGIYFQRRGDKVPYTIRGKQYGLSVEVHSVRTTRRAGPDGQDIRQLVIEVTQRRQAYFDVAKQEAADTTPGDPPKGDFVFRGGATMIIDLRDGSLRYVISKRIDDEARLEAQRKFLGTAAGMSFTYNQGGGMEPFALLHRH